MDTEMMLLSNDLVHCLSDVGPDLDHESAIYMWALVREARRGAGAGAGAGASGAAGANAGVV